MSAGSSKPKSPPTPSRPLGDCVADVKKLYTEYSHGTFAKSEIASVLRVSAGSGPFARRLFTLKEFGLLVQEGQHYKVSESFMALKASDSSDPKFKAAALGAIRSSDVFRELLDELKNKLPSIDAVAGRLESQKRFNADRAKTAAAVLEKSLRYAGVLDGSNNILPIRGTANANVEEADEVDESTGSQDNGVPLGLPGNLGIEIPLGAGRKVAIRYPHDLTSEEAAKVGKVLNAVVS
jgi:hypothetical protein